MMNYEMTQARLDALMDACKPVPAIALNCGTSGSLQERANAAWKALGDEMGFDHMTVKPNGRGDRFFSAQEWCKGIELGDGNYSGCNKSHGDCPRCGE